MENGIEVPQKVGIECQSHLWTYTKRIEISLLSTHVQNLRH